MMAFTRLALVACVVTVLCVPEQIGAETIVVRRAEYYILNDDPPTVIEFSITSTSIKLWFDSPGNAMSNNGCYCATLKEVSVRGMDATRVAPRFRIDSQCHCSQTVWQRQWQDLVPLSNYAVRVFAWAGNTTAVSDEIIVETLDEQQSSYKSDSNNYPFDVAYLAIHTYLDVNTTPSSIHVGVHFNLPSSPTLNSNECWCVVFRKLSGEGYPFKEVKKCAYGGPKTFSLTGLSPSTKFAVGVSFSNSTGYLPLSSAVEVETNALEKEEPSILNNDILHESIHDYMIKFYPNKVNIIRTPLPYTTRATPTAFLATISPPHDAQRNVEHICLMVSQHGVDTYLSMMGCKRPTNRTIEFIRYGLNPNANYLISAFYVSKDSTDKKFHASTTKASTPSHDAEQKRTADESAKQ